MADSAAEEGRGGGFRPGGAGPGPGPGARTAPLARPAAAAAAANGPAAAVPGPNTAVHGGARRAAFMTPSAAPAGVPVGQNRKVSEFDASTRMMGSLGSQGKDMSANMTLLEAGKEQVKAEEAMMLPPGVIHPYNKYYRIWWWTIIGAAVVTGWVEPYQIAFLSTSRGGASFVSALQYILLALFLGDMALSFFVGFYQSGRLVVHRPSIVRHYLSFRFWWDLATTLPWDLIVLSARGLVGSDSATARYIALLGLLKLGRMYRVGRLFSHLEYSLALPLTATLLFRNVMYVIFVVHWAGCAIFYIARQEEAATRGGAAGAGYAHSWVGRAVVGGRLGMSLEELRGGGWDAGTTWKLYIYCVYFSLSTLTSMGYDGSIYPWTTPEVVWALLFMVFNVFFLCYLTGSITLLVFRVHEAWGTFRDKLRALEVYTRSRGVPRDLKAIIQEHMRLQYMARGTDDRDMLASLPTTLKRRVLRHEYGSVLAQCTLLRGVSPKFVDALLCAATIETYMPRVDMLADGDYANDFCVLVDGFVEVYAPDEEGISPAADRAAMNDLARYARTPEQVKRDLASGKEASLRGGTFGGAAAGSEYVVMGPGDVFGAFSFFTEVAQHELVRSLTVCRVMMVPRAAYFAIAADFSLSARTVLENLQKQAEALVQAEFRGGAASRLLRSSLAAAGAYSGLAYQNTSAEAGAAKLVGGPGAANGDGAAEGDQGGRGAPSRAMGLSLRQQQVVGTLQRVRALVRHHVAGALEASTGQFLSACGKGELDRVKLMLGQGFSADTADYTMRTGLICAAAAGQKAVVDVLLAVNARPNAADRSGGTALFEACRAGQDDIIEAIITRGGKLGLEKVRCARELGAAVANGDLPYLQRLLRCGADAAAADSDGNTALHVAAAEGLLAACKALVDAGAPLNATNRYGHTPLDEAHIAQALPVVSYLEGCVEAEDRVRARTKFVNYRTELFLRACSAGDTAEVSAMLARDCPADSADYDARSGLMLAAAKGHRGVLDVLLDAGANPNARDNLGGCALQEAVKAGHDEIAQALQQRGATLNLGSGDLASLLCNLVFERNAALLKSYLAAGADASASDYDKRAPLHIAAAEGDLEMVTLLVEGGAAVNCRDRWGNTPSDEAKRVNARDVAEYLSAAAAAQR